MAFLENNKLVTRAFATLIDAAPNHGDYNAHLKYIDDFGRDHYIATLNNAFSSYSDTQLAALLLKSTGLNGIDLEGDGNIDNMGLATEFIRLNSGNRVAAMLDLTAQLSNITSGPLLDIAKTYNSKILSGHNYSSKWYHTATSMHYNDNFQIKGTPGNDVFYVDDQTGGATYTIGGTGGGFGGCIVALAPQEKVEEVRKIIAENYQKQTGLREDFYVCSASQGVQVC